jgi:hypothetical protein
MGDYFHIWRKNESECQKHTANSKKSVHNSGNAKKLFAVSYKYFYSFRYLEQTWTKCLMVVAAVVAVAVFVIVSCTYDVLEKGL